MIKKEVFGMMSPLLFGLSKDNKTEKYGSTGTIMGAITQFICVIVAVYLALPCKKNGSIDILQIILAICLSPCYIIYRLIYPCHA